MAHELAGAEAGVRRRGEVERADVALDESGRSRGYGTVRFATEAQAMNAIRTLNGADIEGRILTVRMDKYQE